LSSLRLEGAIGLFGKALPGRYRREEIAACPVRAVERTCAVLDDEQRTCVWKGAV